jgi:hypothetical protein
MTRRLRRPTLAPTSSPQRVPVDKTMQSERASVVPVGIRFYPSPLAVGYISAEMQVKNGGRATAIITDGRVVMGAPNQPLPATPNYNIADESPWHAVLLPDQTIPLSFTPLNNGSPIFLPPNNLDAVNKGDLKIRFYGYIVYRDDFSSFMGSTTVGFCYEYNSQGDPEPQHFNHCKNDNYIYVK